MSYYKEAVDGLTDLIRRRDGELHEVIRLRHPGPESSKRHIEATIAIMDAAYEAFTAEVAKKAGVFAQGEVRQVYVAACSKAIDAFIEQEPPEAAVT